MAGPLRFMEEQVAEFGDVLTCGDTGKRTSLARANTSSPDIFKIVSFQHSIIFKDLEAKHYLNDKFCDLIS
jgi:hypothetical protein